VDGENEFRLLLVYATGADAAGR